VYCPECGSQMQQGWVACPRCGHRWEDESYQIPRSGAAVQKAGWYPNRRQWWVIWIAAALIVTGFMLAGGNGVLFAFCVAFVGGLIVWRLQR
jgi:uncharacterized membrane protein YvbJ